MPFANIMPCHILLVRLHYAIFGIGLPLPTPLTTRWCETSSPDVYKLLPHHNVAVRVDTVVPVIYRRLSNCFNTREVCAYAGFTTYCYCSPLHDAYSNDAQRSTLLPHIRSRACSRRPSSSRSCLRRSIVTVYAHTGTVLTRHAYLPVSMILIFRWISRDARTRRAAAPLRQPQLPT